jgi:hypothetical protein
MSCMRPGGPRQECPLPRGGKSGGGCCSRRSPGPSAAHRLACITSRLRVEDCHPSRGLPAGKHHCLQESRESPARRAVPPISDDRAYAWPGLPSRQPTPLPASWNPALACRRRRPAALLGVCAASRGGRSRCVRRVSRPSPRHDRLCQDRRFGMPPAISPRGARSWSGQDRRWRPPASNLARSR